VFIRTDLCIFRTFGFFVPDPRQVVKAGQIVKVRVLKVDTILKRISLSMKMNSDASRREYINSSQNGRRPEQQKKIPHSEKPSENLKTGYFKLKFSISIYAIITIQAKI